VELQANSVRFQLRDRPFRQAVARSIIAEQVVVCCTTLALSQPEATNASSSVSVTSSARIVVHSFQAMVLTRVVIEDGGEVVPAPADDLEISEVGLPELVGPQSSCP